MTVATYITASQKITDRPCILHSVVVGNDGTADAVLTAYNARTADAPYKVAYLFRSGKGTEQYRWEGLELDRGMYIEFSASVKWATVEWEPIKPTEGQGA